MKLTLHNYWRSSASHRVRIGLGLKGLDYQYRAVNVIKDEDGNVAALEIEDLGGPAEELRVFEGASTGIIDDSDLAEAGSALEPGTAAALLVYENSWAGPFAAAVRRSGGQLVASGRIPVQAVLAALEALED